MKHIPYHVTVPMLTILNTTQITTYLNLLLLVTATIDTTSKNKIVHVKLFDQVPAAIELNDLFLLH